MTDRVDSATRSWNMSRVRARDTAPEIVVRRALHAAGYRFRLHRRDLPGCPDIVLVRCRVAIFVHGCFWHQHKGCPKSTLPVQNHAFWKKKLTANRHRDVRNEAALTALGWTVFVLWECELKADMDAPLSRLKHAIRVLAEA